MVLNKKENMFEGMGRKLDQFLSGLGGNRGSSQPTQEPRIAFGPVDESGAGTASKKVVFGPHEAENAAEERISRILQANEANNIANYDHERLLELGSALIDIENELLVRHQQDETLSLNHAQGEELKKLCDLIRNRAKELQQSNPGNEINSIIAACHRIPTHFGNRIRVRPQPKIVFGNAE